MTERTQAGSPLLPQIKTILLNKGFVPVEGLTGVYRKAGVISPPSLIVTPDRVLPFGKPSDQGQSHLGFIADNIKHMFPKVR